MTHPAANPGAPSPQASTAARIPGASSIRQWLGRQKRSWRRRRLARLAPLTRVALVKLLGEELEVVRGDTVFVHSSLAQLPLAFPFDELLGVLLEQVGAEGTLLFPTYPALPSLQFLRSGKTFDVRRSISATGLLTEVARRSAGAARSLHPTKSVCALGRLAGDLTAGHDASPYPYDRLSPYGKLKAAGGKIVGLGVSTRFLSFVHTIDDALQSRFPINPYYPQLFYARCLDWEGQPRTVATYAHDPAVAAANIPRFLRRHVPPRIVRDVQVGGIPFFHADAAALFDALADLAAAGYTIYGRFRAIERAA